MKYLLLLLMVPLAGFSQTLSERQKIVSTYDQSKIADLKREAKAFFAAQKKLIEDYKKANPSYVESEHHSLQRIHDGIPYFFSNANQGSSRTIRANRMYPGGTLGLSVTGAGITAGVWDGGKVRDTHVELAGRITLGDDAEDLSAHATHVTGTLLASGVNTTRKGIAYGAQGITHDWDDDYSEMLDFGAEGYLVSNHSYGYDTENLPVGAFGAYDNSSIEIDEASNLYPYYQIVVAAGNDRNNNDLEQALAEGGYDLISGTGTSKNGITVAAVDELLNYTDPSSVIMSTFSNFGPPDDGRIKPDIAAKGVGTNSCISTNNTAFGIFDGTSMAAPAISGMIVLLQKHYNNMNTTFMKAATVRGLICHTAKEAGFTPGPDYEFGWGLADAEGAANIITNKGINTILEENNLPNSQTFTKQFSINTPQTLHVSICWTDPKGNANVVGSIDTRTPRLKNNLDLKVLKDGNIYYPWKLNPEDPILEATQDSDNDVDNIEKVQINAAEPGTYTIQVTHKGTLVNGAQDFSLIAHGTSANGLGVNNVTQTDNIVLYPNPTKNTLNFAIPNHGEISTVAIYDILGKQVNLTAQVIDNALDVSSLSEGIYFAKFTYNGAPYVKKFVKE